MDPQLANRLEKIESLLAHLQHDMEGLSASLLEAFRRIQQMESRFGRIEQELSLLQDSPNRPDAAADRPPHY